MTSSKIRSYAIAGALAAGAAILVAIYVASYRKQVETGSQLVPVFVAARDIPEGTTGATVAASKYLRRTTAPRRLVVAGAIANVSELGNVATSQTIFSGEQVSIRQFRSLAQQGILAKLTGNTRAMAVPGDKHQLLAGTLKAGDRVDVVANVKYKLRPSASGGNQAADITRVASRVVLRGLVVLEPAELPESGGVGGSDAIAAVLAVTDNQAQKLFFVMKNGEWSLALRPALNDSDSPDSTETIESVLLDGLKPSQWPALIGSYGKESIHGQ